MGSEFMVFKKNDKLMLIKGGEGGGVGGIKCYIFLDKFGLK